MAHAKEPLTRGTSGGGSALTDRGQAKLKGQIDRAGRIIRTSHDSYGKVKPDSKDSHDQAVKMQTRAQKMLGVPLTPHTDGKKKKKAPKKDVHAERREPVEKAARTKNIKDMLIKVATRANNANKE